jgi:DNA processing protein
MELEFCRKLTEDLAPLDPVIVVSPMVDIVAHQLAMEYKLQTIGVVAHGLNQITLNRTKICGQDGGEWRFYDRFWSVQS